MPEDIKRKGGIAGDIPTATNRAPKPQSIPNVNQAGRTDGRSGYTPMAPQGMSQPASMGSYGVNDPRPNPSLVVPRNVTRPTPDPRKASSPDMQGVGAPFWQQTGDRGQQLSQQPSIQIGPSNPAQPPPINGGQPSHLATGLEGMTQDFMPEPRQPIAQQPQGRNIAQMGVDAFTSFADTAGPWVGAGTAVPADALANAATKFMGGDPNTREGGATSHQDKFFPMVEQQVNTAKNAWSNLQGKGRDAMGAEQAQPTAQPMEQPSVQTVGQPTSNQVPTEQQNIADGLPSVEQANQTRGRSFDNANAEGIGANVNSVAGFDPAGSQRANAAFERAIAAGDYESAIQTVDRNDTVSMQRLGQLQGNIREERRQRIANEPTSEQKDAAQRAGIDQQRTMMAARDAMSKGSFRGAERLMNAANGIQSAGQPSGSQPIGDLREGVDSLRESQDTQQGEYAMEGYKRNAEQDQLAQGILQSLRDPNLSASDRQELTNQYSILQGAGQKASERYVMVDQVIGTDMDGKPVTAKVAVDPSSNQSHGVDPQGLPPFFEAAAEARRAIAERPNEKDQIEARLRDMYGRGL